MTESEDPLERARSKALATARAHAAWYRRRKRERQTLSRVTRVIGMVFVSVGGLWPLASQLVSGDDYLGYLLIAAGGAAFALDRLLGLSRSWVRFMVAALEIEAKIDQFLVEYDVLGATEGDGSPTVKKGDLAIKLTSDVSRIVMLETATWTTDFERQVSEASGLASKQRLPSPPN